MSRCCNIAMRRWQGRVKKQARKGRRAGGLGPSVPGDAFFHPVGLGRDRMAGGAWTRPHFPKGVWPSRPGRQDPAPAPASACGDDERAGAGGAPVPDAGEGAQGRFYPFIRLFIIFCTGGAAMRKKRQRERREGQGERGEARWPRRGRGQCKCTCFSSLLRRGNKAPASLSAPPLLLCRRACPPLPRLVAAPAPRKGARGRRRAQSRGGGLHIVA